ncbi:ankyrin repeat-containing domain protein, partial [Colletotrichum acutatum]
AAIIGWSLYHLDSLNGHRALFWGARTGTLSAVKMAIAHGAGPLSPVIDSDYDFGATLNRETALSIAIDNNKIEVVRYLLQGCHPIENVWAQKSYLLHSVKCPKLMEVLLAGGFSNGVNTLGKIDTWDDDVTPLVAAIERNHPESTIRTLLKFGAELNSQNVSSTRPNMSAFHICLWTDRASVTKILIDHNADVNEAEGPEPLSNTPLGTVLLQCQSGTTCDEIVASLLRNGANPNLSTREPGAGLNPIMLASSPDVLPKTFARLLAKGARVDEEVQSELEQVLFSAKTGVLRWSSTSQRQAVQNTNHKLRMLRQLGHIALPIEAGSLDLDRPKAD